MNFDHAGAPRPGEFATTHWTLVLQAGQRCGEQADAALAALCEHYWYPLYVYVRKRVGDVHEAQDLTQAFFARLLEKNVLAAAEPERGRFRAFLLTSLKNFLLNEWDRERTQKRGGTRQAFSFDLDSGESRLGLEPAHELTPEKLYERQWTLTLLERVIHRLQVEFDRAGKQRHFELLTPTLTGRIDDSSYATIATELQISAEAARQAAHRLRKRYRELLREEVSQTVAVSRDVDDEIRSLFASLSNG